MPILVTKTDLFDVSPTGFLETTMWVEGLFPDFKANKFPDHSYMEDIAAFVKAGEEDGKLALTFSYIPAEHFEGDGDYIELEDPQDENAYRDYNFDEEEGERKNLGSGDSSVAGGWLYIAPADKSMDDYAAEADTDVRDYRYYSEGADKGFKLTVEVAGVSYQVEAYIESD